MKTWILSATLLAASIAWAGAKDAPKTHVMQTPEEIEWKPAPDSLPPGAQAALLEGDPKKPGFFALRLKLPAGYKIPAHFHPVQERVTVIDGVFQLGMGNTFDAKALKKYPTGSYLSMPAGMRHFATSLDGAVIQLNTVGPWGISYVDPADDPRKKKS